MRGILIVIDGIDGSGKATQTKLLTRGLRRAGFRVATLDYPQYHRFFGTLIKDYQYGLLGPPVHPKIASVLYEIDRWETKDRILGWLRAGKIVVLDRYLTANQIHQGGRVPIRDRKTFLVWLAKLEHEILGLPKPDVIIYLQVPAKIAAGLSRDRGGRDKMERDLAHQEASTRSAIALAKSGRWKVISCVQNGQLLAKEIIAKKILAYVRTKITSHH